jgi:hypothetical protein
MATLFFSNALGCGAIIGIAAYAPSPAPHGGTDPILIAARRTTSLQERQMESKSMSDRDLLACNVPVRGALRARAGVAGAPSV